MISDIAAKLVERQKELEEKQQQELQRLQAENQSDASPFAVATTASAEDVAKLKDCAKTLKNINAFMLMTIHRCIDYTKSSKGMKLIPKYEIIDFLDVIRFPIDCVTYIQERIEVQLELLSTDITHYVWADRQWLQENLLCLLSNAVKYSPEDGKVTLRVSKRKSLAPSHASSILFMEMENSPILAGCPLISFAPSTTTSSSGGSSTTCSSASDSIKTLNLPTYETMDEEKKLKESLELLIEPPTPPSRTHFEVDTPKIFSFSSTSANSTPTASPSHHLLHPEKPGFLQGEAEELLFEVEDEGNKIYSEEQGMNLFHDPNQSERMNGGTGIGLFSLAKRVEALHGSYGFRKGELVKEEGSRERSQSIFWFSLPYFPSIPKKMTPTNGRSRKQRISTQLPAPLSVLPEEESCACSPMVLPSETANTEKLEVRIPSDCLPSPPERRQSFEESSEPETITFPPTPSAPPSSAVSSRPISCSNTRPDTPQLQHQQQTLQSSEITSKLTVALEHLKNLSILLVDDSPSILKMCSMMLKRQGHTIVIAENGEIALKKLEEKWKTTGSGFDLVLMDLQMPIMDGLAATREIRNYENEGRDWIRKVPHDDSELTSSAPVSRTHSSTRPTMGKEKSFHQIIFGISATSNPETIEQTSLVGMDEFLPKPFSAEHVMEKYLWKRNEYLKQFEVLNALVGAAGVVESEEGIAYSNHALDLEEVNPFVTSVTETKMFPVSVVTSPTESQSEKITVALEHLKNLTILLVDDCPSILKMCSMMLKRQGHIITSAENGEIALKKLEEKWKTTGSGFDLVLMDLQMPVMDGLDATREIRKYEEEGRDWIQKFRFEEDSDSSAKSGKLGKSFHQIIFGISATSNLETTQQTSLVGMDDFLPKPFSVEKVMEKYLLKRFEYLQQFEVGPEVVATPVVAGGGGEGIANTNALSCLSPVQENPLASSVTETKMFPNSIVCSPSEVHTQQVLIAMEHLKHLTILLVDDSPSILKMCSMMLKRQGHIITTAENGEIALMKLEEKWKTTGSGFDLVLMDLQMPVMDGLEATKQIRMFQNEGREWIRKYPTSAGVEKPFHQIIFGISATSSEETIQQTFQVGMDEFLPKPFSVEKVMEKYLLKRIEFIKQFEHMHKNNSHKHNSLPKI
jgi:CheY-like chemotaxis protein